ncbi:hypothetical protein PG997_008005 [Apiospora hydei]|uniref:NACHT domain-containing protein n=1 Tax=Apiospora hydei TaxID=1337664 RepID=A0ABR1W9T9_9PEZI
MEPLAVLGVAGNILQFLDFSQKLCHSFFEIWNSSHGITKANADTQSRMNTFIESADIVVADLQTYIKSLSCDRGNEADRMLHTTLDKCLKLANDLVTRVQTLALPRGAGKWKAARAVVKSLWKEKELLSLQQSLSTYRKDLEWFVLLSIRSSQVLSDSRQRDQFADLQSTVVSRLTDEIRTQFSQLPKWETVDASESVRGPGASRESSETTDETATMARSLASQLAEADRKILSSLEYLVMRDRESAISDAEAETFDWIFEDPATSNKPWDNFKQWLSSDTVPHLYWVNGKAGSGKSTLMKHLFHHLMTREALAVWADQSKLLMAGFFFSYSGSELQKSLEGLLRAMLFACLSENRELIPLAFPDLPQIGADLDSKYWSLERLEAATMRLISQVTLPVKFCFFVDGLDEYAGDHTHIVRFIKQVADYPNVKVCISSRPLLAFEKALENTSKLILQYLTITDMEKFVERHLGAHPRMDELEEQEPGLKRGLSLEISNKASGVFLWVTLVMGSLIEGFENYDDAPDLRRRLDDLPEGLESLYWHMVERVKPKWYLEEGFRLLLLTRAAGGSVHVLTLCFAEMEEDAMGVDTLSNSPSYQKQEELCRNMMGRMKSRCMGLLEVNPEDGCATFLHKSMMDFLETDEAIHAAARHIGPGYVPETRLMLGILRLLKTFITRLNGVSADDDEPMNLDDARLQRSHFFQSVLVVVHLFMELARRAERVTDTDNSDLVDELDSVTTKLWNRVAFRSKGERDGTIHWSQAREDPERSEGTYTVRSSLPTQTRIIPGPSAFVYFTYQQGLRLYPAAKGLLKRRRRRYTPIHNWAEFPGTPFASTCRLQAAEEIIGVHTDPGSYIRENDKPRFGRYYKDDEIGDHNFFVGSGSTWA